MAPSNTSISFELETLATDFVPNGLAANVLRGLIHQEVEQLKQLDDEATQLRFRLLGLETRRA